MTSGMSDYYTALDLDPKQKPVMLLVGDEEFNVYVNKYARQWKPSEAGV